MNWIIFRIVDFIQCRSESWVRRTGHQKGIKGGVDILALVAVGIKFFRVVIHVILSRLMLWILIWNLHVWQINWKSWFIQSVVQRIVGVVVDLVSVHKNFICGVQHLWEIKCYELQRNNTWLIGSANWTRFLDCSCLEIYREMNESRSIMIILKYFLNDFIALLEFVIFSLSAMLSSEFWE